MTNLILGFSVLSGLVARFSGTEGSATCGSANCAIRVPGSNSFEVYPRLIANPLACEKPDRLLLDLVSSPGSRRWTPALFRSAVNYIVDMCHAHGAKVGFLNLCRKDVDQQTDFPHEIVAELATARNVPLLDVLKAQQAAGDDLSKDDPDGIHPYAEGRNALAHLILRFAGQAFPAQAPSPRPAEHAEFDLVSIKSRSGLDRVHRFGFDEGIQTIPGGGTNVLWHGPGIGVEGALMLMGPTTAAVMFSEADAQRSEMRFDHHSYDERLNHVHLAAARADSISLFQSQEVPNFALLKGETTRPDRHGGILACLGTLERPVARSSMT